MKLEYWPYNPLSWNNRDWSTYSVQWRRPPKLSVFYPSNKAVLDLLIRWNNPYLQARISSMDALTGMATDDAQLSLIE